MNLTKSIYVRRSNGNVGLISKIEFQKSHPLCFVMKFCRKVLGDKVLRVRGGTDNNLSEVYKISRVNRQIRAREILVIDENGAKIGVMSPYEGMKLAREKELDLVEVAPKARPPVCRIMDYGKYMYEQSKREKSARKHQKVIRVKEVKFKPDTAEHDYQFKFRHAEKFITSGDKVKATVVFKGREVVHSHLGRQMLERLAKDLNGISTVEQMAKMATNRSMTMILAPKEPE